MHGHSARRRPLVRRRRTLSKTDFERIFDAVPHPYLILSPDLTIIGANRAYLRATLTERVPIVGRPIFTVFPDNPGDPAANGVRNLGQSLRQVLTHREAHSMAWQRYDIRTPAGVFQERHWDPENIPVLDHNGEIDFIIHHVEDVTRSVKANLPQAEMIRSLQSTLGRLRNLVRDNRITLAASRSNGSQEG
jgi:PAS domain-containing protein